ncbi:MAG: CvpA family protein [Oscillospiraceae bacterium]|jgi:uncharacterized membrane protein required for colicin V production|nr:CvpA family protein [Oscillospiraceae bacterium]
MGENLHWFYDLIIVGVVLASMFSGYKKGFAGIVLSLTAMVAAVLSAVLLSGSVANFVYKNFLEGAIEDRISKVVKESVGELPNLSSYKGLSYVDTENIIIGQRKLADIEPEIDSTGKAILDLSNVNLSYTGIDRADLSAFGLSKAGLDLAHLDLGKVEITASELAGVDRGELFLTKILDEMTTSGSGESPLGKVADKFSGMYSGDMSRIIRVLMNSGETDTETAFRNEIIRPTVMRGLTVVCFLLIYGIVFGVASSVCGKVAGAVRHVPVVGSLNSLGGALLGFVKAIIIILFIGIAVRLIVSATDDSGLFFNSTVINDTTVFKQVYDVDLLA